MKFERQRKREKAWDLVRLRTSKRPCFICRQRRMCEHRESNLTVALFLDRIDPMYGMAHENCTTGLKSSLALILRGEAKVERGV